jgi:hypothetical protein
MTVSHFETLDDAVAAQKQVEEWWPAAAHKMQFPVSCVYLLERKGDDGQFLRVADIALGANNAAILHNPPIPFCHMPTTEVDWVREERIKMKRRRQQSNANCKWRRRKGRPRRPAGPRIKDSPDVIAAKRAARKSKREAAVAASLDKQQ